MYRGCQTKVRSAAGESGSFNVDVGLHQGSALSPYLFLILMDVLTEGVRKEVPESMMFADDIVLCGGREVDMTEYLDTWRKSLEEIGMRVSRPKTQFMDFNFEQSQQGNREPVKILGEELERVTHFKYLGTSMEEEGGMETEITKRVGAGWRNWKKCSGVLCDRRGRYTKQWSGQQCYIWQKRGLQRRDKKNWLRWPRWGCQDGCAEWHAKTKSGMNTYEEQQEWRRLPKRSPREERTGTGMWWGEMANTYWGKCWGRIYQGKGREDDRKQDGKTRVNEIWKVLDWERARRRTGRCGEERSPVIPATLHDGKSQRKRRRLILLL